MDGMCEAINKLKVGRMFAQWIVRNSRVALSVAMAIGVEVAFRRNGI